MPAPRRRVRVGYLIPSLRPGGAERQMLLIAAGLPKDRFEVDFLSLIGEGPLDQAARDAGAGLILLGDTALSGRPLVRRLIGRVGKIGSYVRVARRRRYDVIDAWLFPTDSLVAITRPLVRPKAVLSGRRNMDPHEGPRPVVSVVDRLTDRLVDAVIANSAAAGRYAVAEHGVHPSRVRIIRNGVHLPPPVSPEDRVAVRAELGAGPSDLLIGCVGNYKEVKRLDRLIDAFAAVARERPSARLVLVGEGPERAALERQIAGLGLQERVRLYGTSAEPMRLYPAFDLVVQASRSEGLPNVLLEAAAAGRPIVATAAGGTPEIVLDGVTGLLIPVDAPERLAPAMLSLIDQPELRSTLGAAARQHVATSFSVERLVAEFADLYTSLARGAPITAGEPLVADR